MLTEQEAFAAMRFFLAEFWKRGGSQSDSDPVDILSWTETLDDSGTYDPAQWHDWLAAVEAVRAGDRARPFEASRYQPLSLRLSESACAAAGPRADMSPFVSPSALDPSSRAKAQRNHNPRVVAVPLLGGSRTRTDLGAGPSAFHEGPLVAPRPLHTCMPAYMPARRRRRDGDLRVREPERRGWEDDGHARAGGALCEPDPVGAHD